MIDDKQSLAHTTWNCKCQRQLSRETLGYEASVFSCVKAPGFSLLGKPGNPKWGKTNNLPIGRRRTADGQKKSRKRKSRPSRACIRQHTEARDGLDRKEIFSPLSGLIGED